MKNKLFIVLFTLSIALALLGIYIASFNNLSPFRPVTIATVAWEPFVGPDLPSNGPVGNIVFETIYRMGYKPEFSYSSWDLCLDKTKQSLVLGTFPGIMTEERKDTFAFSAPVMRTDYVLFFNKEVMKELAGGTVPDTFDLYRSDLKFGKVKGYEVWEALDTFMAQKDTILLYNTVNEAFQALADNKVHFIPEGKIPGLQAVRRPSLSADADIFGYIETDTNSIFCAEVDFHLMMKKESGSSSFLKAFDETLEKVKSKSAYEYEMQQIEENSIRIVRERVIIQAYGDAAFARVYADSARTRPINLPLGTRAVVIKWPRQFTEEGASRGNDELYCKIKLLNGPLRGRALWADSRSISLNN